MELSCRVIVSNSAGVNSSRARCATHAISSAVSDMKHLVGRRRNSGGRCPPGLPSREAPPAGRHRETNCRERSPWRSASSSDGRHLERLAPLRPLDQAAAHALDADAHGLDAAADLDLDALQVGAELALAAAADLPADAAQVLGLTA